MAISFELEEETEVTSIGDLKDEFYLYHKVKKKEKRKGFRDRQLVLRPISLILNPSAITGTANDKWQKKKEKRQRHKTSTVRPIVAADIYIAIYYKHYYVKIECGRSEMQGPHKLELCYQIAPGNHVRLGTWQSCFCWWDERALRKKLKKAILMQKYFCSDETSNQIIELNTHEAIVSI